MEYNSSMVKRVQELRCFELARSTAMSLFELTKGWPREELYGMVAQCRDSSRSVCANLAEAWAKRRYEASFVSKLTDSLAEAEETRVWIDFAYDCRYITETEKLALGHSYDEIIGGIVKMMSQPARWCGPSILREDVAQYEA